LRDAIAARHPLRAYRRQAADRQTIRQLAAAAKCREMTRNGDGLRRFR
jgi:hypothetical protein